MGAQEKVQIDAGLRELVEEVLGQRVDTVHQLAVDAYNAHYRVEAEQGTLHMVRYFNTGDAALEGISFEHDVLLHLERRGFLRLPRLFQRDGETIFRRGDDYFAFSEWIDGCATIVDRPIAEAAVDGMARCMAEMHRAMEGFDRELAYLPEHMFVFPAAEVRRKSSALVERLGLIVDDAENEAFDEEARSVLRQWLPTVEKSLERLPWSLYEEVWSDAPQRLVHGDLRLLNLVFNDDEVSTVLDFNASFNEVRLWDLCYTSLSLAGTETLGAPRETARASRFLETYHRVHPLRDAERRLLPDFMRFTVTKLMLAAPCSWWVVQRAPLLTQLEEGLAEEICDRVL